MREEWLRGERSVRLNKTDTLAAYFSMRLTERKEHHEQVAKTARGSRRPRKGSYSSQTPGQGGILRHCGRAPDVGAMGANAPAAHVCWWGTGLHGSELLNATKTTYVGTKPPMPRPCSSAEKRSRKKRVNPRVMVPRPPRSEERLPAPVRYRGRRLV